MKKNSNPPAILQRLSNAAILAALGSNNMCDVIDAIGADAALLLIRCCGGQHLYIPKLDAVIRAERNRRIRSAFRDGLGIDELADSYRLSVRQIYKILQSPTRRPQDD